jgi:hypothetical protein
MAQAHLGTVYNRDGYDLVDNYTYGTRRSMFIARSYVLNTLQFSLAMVA